MSNDCCNSEDPICCQIGDCPNSANGCPQTCIDGACVEICTLNQLANDCIKICINGNCVNADPCCDNADPECCKSNVKCDPVITKTIFGNILCPTHCENGKCVLDDKCCGRFDCCSSNFCAGIEIDGCPTICKDNLCVKERCCGNGNFNDCCDSVDPCCEINNSGGCPSINGCAQECKNGKCVVSNPCCLEDSDLRECCEAVDKKCCQLEKLGNGCVGKNTSQCTYNCVDGDCIPNDDCCNTTNPTCCFINKNFGDCDEGLKKSTKYDPSIDCDIYVCVPDCPAIPPTECDKTCRTITKIYENGCLVDIQCEDCDCPTIPPITCEDNCVPTPITSGGCTVGYRCSCKCPAEPDPITCPENCTPVATTNEDGCVTGYRCSCKCPAEPDPITCPENCTPAATTNEDGCVTGYRCSCKCPAEPDPITCPENCTPAATTNEDGCVTGYRCSCKCPAEPDPITCPENCTPAATTNEDGCVTGYRCSCKCPAEPDPITCPENCTPVATTNEDGCVTGYRCSCKCPAEPDPITCPKDCNTRPIIDNKCVVGYKCDNCTCPLDPEPLPITCPDNNCTPVATTNEDGCVTGYRCSCKCPAEPDPITCPENCTPAATTNEDGCVTGYRCSCKCPAEPDPITCPENCTPVATTNEDGCVTGYRCSCKCPAEPDPITCPENCIPVADTNEDGCVTGYRCSCKCPAEPDPITCPENCTPAATTNEDGCVTAYRCSCKCPAEPDPITCPENCTPAATTNEDGCVTGYRCSCVCPEIIPIPCDANCTRKPIIQDTCITGYVCTDCNKCPPAPPVQCPPNSNICGHKPILDNDQCVVGFDCIPCDEDCPPAPPIDCQNSCGSAPKIDSKGCITGHICLPCDDPKCPDAPPVKCPANSCGWTTIPDENGCVVDYTCIPCKEDCDPAPPINCPNSCGSTPLTNDQGCVISHKCKPCENDNCPPAPTPICAPGSCDMLVEYDDKECPIKYTCVSCNYDCGNTPPIDCPIDTCDIQPVLQNGCVVDHDCIPCQKPKDCPNIPTPVCAPNSSFKTLYDKDTGCPIEHTCIPLNTDCEIVEQVDCPENTCSTIPIITDDGCTVGFDCVPCECPNTIIACPVNTCDVITVKVNHCDTFVCEECECPQTALPVCKSDQELVTSLDSNGCTYYYCEVISSTPLSGSTIISAPKYGDSYISGESIEIQYFSDIPFIISTSGTGTLGITQTSGLNTNSPTISGTVNAPDGSTVSVVVDGDRTITATVNNGNWSVTIPNLANGTNNLDITTEDPQGNVVDTLATDITIRVPTSGTGTLGITQTSGLNTNSPTISGTVNAPDGSTVSVVVDGDRTITATVNNGNWSVTIPNLANGTNNLDITTEDPQGNVVDTLATDINIIKPAEFQNDTYIAIVTDDNTILKAYPDFNDQRTTKNPEPGYANENVYNSVVFKYTIQPEDVSKEPFLILSAFQNSNFKFDTNDDKSFVDEAINTNVRLNLKNPNKYKINSGPTFKNTDINLDSKKYATGDTFTISIELDQPVSILTPKNKNNVKLNIEYGNDVYNSNFDMTLDSINNTENSSILTFTYTITDKDYFDSNNNFVASHYIRTRAVFGASLVANQNIVTDTISNLDILQYLPANNLSFNSTSYISAPKKAITTDNNILVINDNDTISIIDSESLSMIGLINNIDQNITDAVFLDNGLIAVLTDDNTITILDSKNASRIINTVNEISNPINSLDSSGDNLIINTNKDILSINTYELKPDIYTIKQLNPVSNINTSFVDKENNILYVIDSVAKEIVAVNINNGSTVNSFKTNNNITNIVVKDDTIYVTTDQNQFISYNTHTGEIIDSIFIDKGNNSLTIAEDFILIGNDITNTIRKYDTITNTITDTIGSGGITLIKTLFIDNIIYSVNKDNNTIIKINVYTNQVENYCPPPFLATSLPPIPEIS